ncbi:MAG TPA: hypothetical protein DIV41_05840 [Ruminococcaceae bacterium]|nr:hypothetical protein [Oscillospiraceae bacterium]
MNKIKFAVLLLACAAAVLPLSACSGKNDAKQADAKSTVSGTGKSASQTEITGKVTSIVGNKVELALGTVNSDSGKADEKTGSEDVQSSGQQDGEGSKTVSSGASSSTGTSSSGSGSVSITLTGETDTVIIPVGLTLSQNSGGGTGGPPSGGDSGSGGENGGGGQMPQDGGSTQSGGSAQGGTNSAAGGTSTKTSDFSSITKGMILRITEEKASDGTENVVKVTVLSE